MRDIFTVVKFTMKDMVKRKSFIISTLIILTFIVVGFNVPNLIKSFNIIWTTQNKLNNHTLGYIKVTKAWLFFSYKIIFIKIINYFQLL